MHAQLHSAAVGDAHIWHAGGEGAGQGCAVRAVLLHASCMLNSDLIVIADAVHIDATPTRPDDHEYGMTRYGKVRGLAGLVCGPVPCPGRTCCAQQSFLPRPVGQGPG